MFNLGDPVGLKGSNERGTVIGKAEYVDGGPQYYIHYCDAQGKAKTGWFYPSQLT